MSDPTSATQPTQHGQRRPLLIHGERLRQSASRPDRGGGPKFKPYSVEESIARLTPQVEGVREAIAHITSALRGDELIVQARLLPQFLSASSFPGALFAAAGLVPIGTRPDRADTYTKADGLIEGQPTKTVYLAVRDDLARLDLVLRGRAGRQNKETVEDFQALDAIELPEPFVATERPEGQGALVLDGDGLALFESALHGTAATDGKIYPATGEVAEKWAALVSDLGGRAELGWARPAGSVLFMPVRLAPDRAQEARQFNPLRAVQPMPRLRTLPDPEREADAFFAPDDDPSGDSPLRVAVFDGGVDDTSPYWAGRVRNIVVGALTDSVSAQRHGALVTSAMIYGHVDGATLPAPAAMTIDHYAALPQADAYAQDLEMYWLLDVITEQVRTNDYDVVTVCAAPNRLMTDGPVDRWTSTLDNLSHERQVLFVVAAGNNGNDPAYGGLNRILVPADATNAIAVGAADSPVPRASRADYSAVGPGRPGAQMRPSGIAFGGVDTVPFIAVDNDGGALRFSGTSCSAPLVTHSLADLAARIGRPRVTPVNLRAFALHFTMPCKRGSTGLEVGLGHFCDSYDFLQDSPPNEAHVLYAGSVAREEFIPLSIPVPDGHSGKLELRYTLVTSTETNGADSVDYTKAGLEVAFRPHAMRYAFSKKDQKTVIVDTAENADMVLALLRDGYKPAAEPVTDSIGITAATEGELRAEGKWDSVRTGRHTYRDSASKVFRPRIEISHLARESGLLVHDSPDLDWALLVTLRADDGTMLYDQVRNQYKVLSMLPTATVSVRTRSA